MSNYYTVRIPWEDDPKRRTEWHPTTPEGPFKVLARGAFKTELEARQWAADKLGPSANFNIQHIGRCECCEEEGVVLFAPRPSDPDQSVCETCFDAEVRCLGEQ